MSHKIGITTILGEIRRWINNAEEEGKTDDSHVYDPPCWPTLGTLKKWEEALTEAVEDDE